MAGGWMKCLQGVIQNPPSQSSPQSCQKSKELPPGETSSREESMEKRRLNGNIHIYIYVYFHLIYFHKYIYIYIFFFFSPHIQPPDAEFLSR